MTESQALNRLHPCVAGFLAAASQENEVLRRCGATETAAIREVLLDQLVRHTHAWLDREVGVREAAQILGKSEETVRRAVRNGAISDRRDAPGARHRIPVGDLLELEPRSCKAGRKAYDPVADA